MSIPEPSEETHLKHLRHALSLARKSPPKDTNFRVGCVIVSFTSESNEGDILSDGYTLELEGNTHAEQNALAKLARECNVVSDASPEEHVGEKLTPEMNVYLYTTLEPCGLRLSGSLPCVQRIIATRERNAQGGIRKVVFGAREPGTFVQDSQSLKVLDDAGVQWEYVQGLEDEILRVAKEGHRKAIDDISPEERKRQDEQPRNPKKRMMEVDISR